MRVLEDKEIRDAQIFFQAAADAARKARCLKRPRGVALVLGGKVISTGYNAPADAHACKKCLRDKWKPVVFAEFNTEPCYSVHAEQRAIIDAYKSGYKDLSRTDMYFVRLENDKPSPCGKPTCSICAKFMREAEIRSFIYQRGSDVVAYTGQEFLDDSFEWLENNATTSS